MKKLLILLSVTFAFTYANAQCSHAGGTHTKTATKTEPAKTETTKGKACSGTATKAAGCSGANKKNCAKKCGSSTAAYNKVVSPNDFAEYMKRFPSEQVVDIRTKPEIKANGMIEGAQNIDFKASYFKEEILKLDKDKAIMIYCRSGRRSAQAVQYLKDWGFKKIYDLQGGYNAYLQAFPKK